MANGDKSSVPGYIAYSFFTSFLNGLRETHIPLRIDRSVMAKASGSQVSATIQTLRHLALIDENSKPNESMKQLVEAADEERGAILKKLMLRAYGFVINSEFDLEKATGQLVADKFREQGVQGSTLTKAIAFFLSAAKDAGIKVSPHVKPPAAPSQPKEKRRLATSRRGDEPEDEEEGEEEADDAMVRFELPIPGKRNAIVTVPDDLEPDDWEMLTKMLDLYIKRLQRPQGG